VGISGRRTIVTRPSTIDRRLPFSTKPVVVQGIEVEEYVIPDHKKELVLRALYPFFPVPGMDEEWLDIHTDKKFRVREFRVTREGGHNFLVSPYYEEGGGTVIDWVPADETSRGWEVEGPC
jgi:hypothetical protein